MRTKRMTKKRDGLGIAALLATAALVLASCDGGSTGSDPEIGDSSSSVSSPASSGIQTNSSSSALIPVSSSSSVTVNPSSSAASSSSGTQTGSSSSTPAAVSSSSSAASSSSGTQINSSSSSAIIIQSSSATVNSSSSATVQSSSSWFLPLNPLLSYGSMTDPRDGRTYATIVLNGYTVMAQNLDYGTQVPGIAAADDQSDDSKVEKYCYNDSALYCERYGGLYQWAEALALPSSCNTESCADRVDTAGFHQGICPDGWHLPWREEWKTMINPNSAYNMKSDGEWYQGGGGSNSTGFTFLPAGERTANESGGGYGYLSKTGTIWYIAIHPTNLTYGYTVFMYYSSDGVPQQTPWYKTAGFSVRCIQDYTTGE